MSQTSFRSAPYLFAALGFVGTRGGILAYVYEGEGVPGRLHKNVKQLSPFPKVSANQPVLAANGWNNSFVLMIIA
jgi:hypothetical protein